MRHHHSRHRTRQIRSNHLRIRLLALLVPTLLLSYGLADAQPYRYWQDTTIEFSMVKQISQSREVTFYPFDSSQSGGTGYTRRQFLYEPHYSAMNAFTDFAYDTTVVISSHGSLEPGHDQSDIFPRREAHYDTGMAGQTVASGIVFDYRPQQTERWEKTWDGSNWVTTSNPINSSAFFEGIVFDEKYAFRSPHYLVVTGHLFQLGQAADVDPLVRVNVYYEVGVGSTYRDSALNYVTASSNERFLYKSIDFTKADLLPASSRNPDWNAHRLTAKEINFEQEGMGGPTAEGVTAHSIDIEVIYLGGEKVALHSVALRDSITHSLLREDEQGDVFRAFATMQIESLLPQTSTESTRAGIASDTTPDPDFSGDSNPFLSPILYRYLHRVVYLSAQEQDTTRPR